MIATEAEIFKNVALEAIKTTWKWRMAWAVGMVIVIVLLIISALADYHKMIMLRDIETKLAIEQASFGDAERWNQLLYDTQHQEVLKSCIKHHTSPPWGNYPQLPLSSVPSPTPTPVK